MPLTTPQAFFAKYRDWQWIKHLILGDYLEPWSMKVGSTAPAIYVVDAFAGAGSYQKPGTDEVVPGSPVIEARSALEYAQARPNKRMQVICVERDPETYAQLCEAMRPYADVVKTLPGDFYAQADAILSKIGNAPALLLLDPIGLKPITADRCRELVQRAGKTDVFIIVGFIYVHRTAGQLLLDGEPDASIAAAAQNVANIDAFVGTRDWRTIALTSSLSRHEKERAYLDLYFKSVFGNRYHFTSAYSVRPSPQGARKYWLVHASDHEDAFWLMNNAIVKVDDLLVGRTSVRADELPGIGEAISDGAIADRQAEAEGKLRADLVRVLREKPGGVATFGRLRAELMFKYFGRVKEGAYSRALKQLVRDRVVTREARPAAKFELGERITLAEGLQQSG